MTEFPFRIRDTATLRQAVDFYLRDSVLPVASLLYDERQFRLSFLGVRAEIRGTETQRNIFVTFEMVTSFEVRIESKSEMERFTIGGIVESAPNQIVLQTYDGLKARFCVQRIDGLLRLVPQ